MDHMDKLVRLNRHQIQAAAAALARAFWDYPVARSVFPKESDRRARLLYFCESSLRYGIRYGEVCASSLDLEGIAVWLPSNKLPLTYWRMLWSGALFGMLKMGPKAGHRMQPIGDHVDATRKRLAPFDHWYLLMLGVDPGFRKQGISSKLVRPMLERFRMERLPCYVDTLDEQNVDLYKHFGFELIERSAIRGTDLHCWAFLKKP